MNPEDVKRMVIETITRPNDPNVVFAIKMLNSMMAHFDNSDHPDAREIVEKFRQFTYDMEHYL